MTDPKYDPSEEIDVDLTSEPDEAAQEDDQEVDPIAELTAERDEYRDRFMRAMADAENMRKRADRDRSRGRKLWWFQTGT